MKKGIVALLLATMCLTACGSTKEATPVAQSSSSASSVSESVSVVSEAEPEVTEEVVEEVVEAAPAVEEEAPTVEEDFLDAFETQTEEALQAYTDSFAQSVEEVKAAVGTDLHSYIAGKETLDKWYETSFESSKVFWTDLYNNSAAVLRVITQQYEGDRKYDWNSDLADAREIVVEAWEDYGDIWRGAFDEVKTTWDDAVGEYESEEYDLHSDTWDEAYDIHDDAWSDQYDLGDDAFDSYYDVYDKGFDALYDGEPEEIEGILEKYKIE